MLWQVVIAFGALLLAGACHFAILSKSHRYLVKSQMPEIARFLVMLSAATVGQMLSAAWFAVSFRISSEAGLGGFEIEGQISWMDTYYFSLVNLTTLGLGDIVPTGHLKFLAGIEAMTGFLLISCSASHIFMIMKMEGYDYE
ncbi:potassium channel family protein [Haliea salexigens]|jgi:potassium channel LctB|uniref:potassium channel family protein n=1 Tax=Haliea salexigens TaxID=287487 RepID=UPI0004837479|nr:potassium channel family protein [Haliea salexigens]|tara:strand:- start:1917 stop:2342 length:426 start_codon:yes stop_codon:yes gene_type:complete